MWFIDEKLKMIANLIDEEDEYGTVLVTTYWFRDAVSREDLDSLGINLSKSQGGGFVLDDFDTYGVESNRFYMQSYLYRSLEMEWLCAGEIDRLDEFFDDLRETHCANYGIPRDWIEDFPSGYMKRAMHLFPKQGNGPWQNTQDFSKDKKMIRRSPIDDQSLVFSSMTAS